jgi:hypothetical protein
VVVAEKTVPICGDDERDEHGTCLNGDLGRENRMVLIPHQFDLAAIDVLQTGQSRIESQPGEGIRRPTELFINLVQMVGVNVNVSKGVDEVAHANTRDLSDQMGQQGVAGDVERDAQEQVSRTLVELARELV